MKQRGRPQKEVKAKSVTITLEEKDLEQLKQEAKEKRMSLSTYIRSFITFTRKEV